MEESKKQLALTDLADALSADEVEAIMLDMAEDYPEVAKDPEVVEAAAARTRVLNAGDVEEPAVEEAKKEGAMTKEKEMAAIMAELKMLREAFAARAAKRSTVVVRGGRRYRLLKDDVTWCDTPQVHGIMGILKTFMKVGGDPVDEATIVAKVIEHEAVLDTKQGGKKIWDYYKGQSEKGLVAHGNLERL